MPKLVSEVLRALGTFRAEGERAAGKAPREQLRGMTPGESVLAALDRASDPRSSLSDRMDVMADLPGVGGVTRALKGTRVFHGVDTARVEGELNPSLRRLLSGQKPSVFKHFDPTTAGRGAGGDLYGKGIYLTEHPRIASGYSRGRGMVRTHNIPPQAKILDLEASLNTSEISGLLEKLGPAYKARYTAQVERFGSPETVRGVHDVLAFPGSKVDWPSFAKQLGYDGISYKAGQVIGLPRGVPKNTRNYVIYNYDIINNPRSLMPKAKPQPEKALRRFPSKRDKLLIERRKQAQKVAAERRRPTREEVEFLLKKRGMFAW